MSDISDFTNECFENFYEEIKKEFKQYGGIYSFTIFILSGLVSLIISLYICLKKRKIIYVK